MNTPMDRKTRATTKSTNKPIFSVIVPTYHEVSNISPLTTRLFKALQSVNLSEQTELIIVDDNSADGTEAEVERLGRDGYPIRIIVRKAERGLSGAVLRGFQEAQGEFLLCMDADLQHPPEKVPEMFACLQKNGVEYVLGTRYGGKEFSVDRDWPLYRQVISKGARMLARPLTPLSDPMSGFFGMKREVYESAKNVSALGFKIALEFYVKAKVKKHEEVPIVFGVRTAGESKLTGKVIVHYLRHLGQLYPVVYGRSVVLGLVLVVLLMIVFVWRYLG